MSPTLLTRLAALFLLLLATSATFAGGPATGQGNGPAALLLDSSAISPPIMGLTPDASPSGAHISTTYLVRAIAGLTGQQHAGDQQQKHSFVVVQTLRGMDSSSTVIRTIATETLCPAQVGPTPDSHQQLLVDTVWTGLDSLGQPREGAFTFSVQTRLERRDEKLAGHNAGDVSVVLIAELASTLPGTVTCDFTAPNITITSPAAGVWTRAHQITMIGRIEDNLGVAHASVNGISVPLAPDGTFTTVLPLPTEGPVQVTIEAQDLAGNANSLVHELFVDRTNPVVTISSPEDFSFLNQPQQSIEGHVAEDHLASLVVQGQPITPTPDGSFSLAVTLSEGPDNTITATATDLAGNTGSTSVRLTLDLQPPTISALHPASGSWTSALDATLNGRIEDDHGVASASVNGVPVTLDPDGAFSTVLPLPIEGPVQVTIEARDLAGNANSLVHDFFVDRTNPVVAISSPEDFSFLNQPQQSIEGHVAEDHLASLVVQGQPITPAPDGSFSLAVTLSEGPDNTITATATDLAGNSGSTSVRLTLDLQPPTISALHPASGSWTSALDATLSGRIEDDHGVATASVNGVPVTLAPDGTFSTVLPLPTEGPVQVSIEAQDLAGNAASLAHELVVDRAPPVVELFTPAEGEAVGEIVVVTGRVTEQNLLSLTLNGAAVSVLPDGTFGPVELAVAGECLVIEALARDLAGNEGAATRTVHHDTLVPARLVITEPVPGAIATSATWSTTCDGWQDLPPMPTPRTAAAAGVVDGLFVVVGGRDGANAISGATEIWDPAAGAWRQGAPMPRPRDRAAAAAIGGKLYVVGGYDTTYRNYVDVYDPVADSWAALAAAPETLYSHALVALDGRLHAIGGRLGAYGTSNRHIVYDPATNAWTAAPALSTGRLFATAVVREGKIHVVGGAVPYILDQYTYLTTHQVYDPATTAWTTLAALPFGRAFAAAVPTADGLRLVGGSNGVATVGGFSYDATSNVWTQAGGIRGRSVSFAWAEADGRLFVAGGTKGGAVTGSFRSFSPEQDLDVDVWRRLANGPVDWSFGHSVVAVDGQVYVLSGSTSAIQPMHRLDPVSGTWTACAAKPGGASYNTKMAVLDGRIYALGGTGTRFDVYDPLLDAWEQLPSKPATPDYWGVEAHGGKIYVPQRTATHVFDPATRVWSMLPGFETVRRYFGTAVIGDRLHVVGFDDWSAKPVAAHDVLDPATGTWSSAAPLPVKVSSNSGCTGALAHEGLLYVVAAALTEDAGSYEYSVVLTYDPASDAWTRGIEVGPNYLRGVAAGVDDTIYVVGSVGTQRRFVHSFVPGRHLAQVLGTCDGGIDEVRVNGRTTAPADFGFAVDVPVHEGLNAIVAAGLSSGVEVAASISDLWVDRRPPLLTVTAPLEGPASSHVVEVRGRVADDGLTTLLVGGSPVPWGPDGSFATLVQIPRGASEILVQARDRAGHETVRRIAISLESDAPELLLEGPLGTRYVTASPVVVRGRALDEDLLEVTFDGTPLMLTGDTFEVSVDVPAEGRHVWFIARDGAGNETVREFDIVLDDAAPQVAIDRPCDSSLTSDPAALVTGTVWDENLQGVTVAGLACAVADGRFSVLVPLAEGPNDLTAIARDLAGAESSATVRVLRHSGAPRLAVAQPLEGAFLPSMSVLVQGTAQDPDGVSVTVNDVPATQAGESFQAQVEMPEGPGFLTVRARDGTGLVAEAQVRVVVDTTAPQVTLNEPQDQLYTTAAQVRVAGTVDDATACSVAVAGVAVPLVAGAFERMVPLAEGMNDLAVIVRDVVLNETTVTRRVVRDTISPVIHVDSPLPGAWMAAVTVEVAGHLIEVNPDSVTVAGLPATLEGGDFSCPAVPLTTEGSCSIVITARDRAGNETTSTLVVQRDTTLPTLSLEPSDGTTDASTLARLALRWSDGGSGIAAGAFQAFIDDEDRTSDFTPASGGAYIIPYARAWPPGPHELRGRVSDVAGNQTEMVSSFTVVDDLPPVLTAVAVTRKQFSPAPNPYEPGERRHIEVTYEVSEPATVTLQAWNQDGRCLATRTATVAEAGPGSVSWDGRTDEGRLVRPGLYELRLDAIDPARFQSSATRLFVRVTF